MQPYFFPYIGYFQLVNAVTKFVLYDDVNYIKGGWINRNNILISNNRKLFTLNLVASSTNKDINEIRIGIRSNKVIKTLKQAYVKAPFFNNVFPLIEEVFDSFKNDGLISEIAGLSIMKVAKYLNINTEFEYSSKKYPDTKGMKKVDRLIEICNRNNADTYINAAGGVDLYSKSEFKKDNINLFFIHSQVKEYKQFDDNFCSHLSIIDVMMFNSVNEINKMLDNYELE